MIDKFCLQIYTQSNPFLVLSQLCLKMLITLLGNDKASIEEFTLRSDSKYRRQTHMYDNCAGGSKLLISGVTLMLLNKSNMKIWNDRKCVSISCELCLIQPSAYISKSLNNHSPKHKSLTTKSYLQALSHNLDNQVEILYHMATRCNAALLQGLHSS